MIIPANGSTLLDYAVAAAVAGATSALLASVLLRLRLALDTPNDRSLHASPVPRTGGIGLLAGAFLGTALSAGIGQPAIWIALALAALSFFDDRWRLPVAARLLGHLAAATAFVLMLGDGRGILAAPILILALAWMTNLYNFMDGADGLAGGMTVFGFGAFGVAAGMQGHGEIAALSLCVAAAALGFLVFNYPPARIFMGDVGSIPVGFLAGAIGLLGWHEGIWPMVFPVIVFAPFVVDATVTLARRAIRKERVWLAHREHYYQSLILGGWTHRKAALAEYALMMACAAAGVVMVFAGPMVRVAVIAVLACVLVSLMAAIDLRRARQRTGAA
jgi:UDP-N-acetylmuramyl pentapeptide phosphotransferase/UDP-N-acetylglucosamine-1-phosphate transferase